MKKKKKFPKLFSFNDYTFVTILFFYFEIHIWVQQSTQPLCGHCSCYVHRFTLWYRYWIWSFGNQFRSMSLGNSVVSALSLRTEFRFFKGKDRNKWTKLGRNKKRTRKNICIKFCRIFTEPGKVLFLF